MSVNNLILIFSVAAFIGAVQGIPQEIEAFIMQFQQICIDNTGSDKGHRQLLTSIEPAKSCLMNRISVEQLQSDLEALASESRKQFFNKYCPQFKESLNCFNDTFEGVAKCIIGDTDQAIVLIREIVDGFLDLLCRNDGQLYDDAQKPEFKDCIREALGHSQDCEVTNITSYRPITGFGEQDCREFEDSRVCLKGKIEDCQASGVFDIFDVLLSAVSKVNDCKQYILVNEITNNDDIPSHD